MRTGFYFLIGEIIPTVLIVFVVSYFPNQLQEMFSSISDILPWRRDRKKYGTIRSEDEASLYEQANSNFDESPSQNLNSNPNSNATTHENEKEEILESSTFP